jgi:hypothetical protein
VTEKHERVRIERLTSDPKNARRHPERNIEAIMASLNKFGQQRPVVVLADNTVIAGNGTLEAAKRLGWEELWVSRTNLSADEARAFAIADNRSSELAAWDDDTLRAQLSELREVDSALANAAGYSDEELRSLLERAPEAVANLGQVAGGISELPSGFTRTLEEYDASQVRQLVFTYTASQYGLIVEALAQIAEDNSLETNADVLVYLLEKAGHAVSERAEADD